MLLQVTKAQELSKFYTKRWNEKKLGEVVKTLPNGVFSASSLLEAKQAGAKYALLGQWRQKRLSRGLARFYAKFSQPAEQLLFKWRKFAYRWLHTL